MAGIGDIVTRLTVDRRDFEKGLTGAGRDVQRFSGTVASAGGNSRKATMALLELSRGAEDAASQFGTQGLAGALRGSMNNLSAMATMLNPMAGVIVGLGAAIASVLIPRLMEMKTAADLAKESVGSLDEAIKKASGGRDVQEREQALRRDGGGLDEQRGRVTAIRGEMADISTVMQNARRGILMARETGDDALLEELEKQHEEAAKRYADAGKRLETEERLLREGEASQALRDKKAREKAALDAQFTPEGVHIDLIRAHEKRRKQFEVWDRPEREEREIREKAVANYEQFAMQRSLSLGLGSRLAGLYQQRQAIMFGGPSAKSPELATRGSAVDRIIEIAQAKREAKEETYRKTQLEKLDKQIELTEKLIEEVRSGDGLKPAGVG